MPRPKWCIHTRLTNHSRGKRILRVGDRLRKLQPAAALREWLRAPQAKGSPGTAAAQRRRDCCDRRGSKTRPSSIFFLSMIACMNGYFSGSAAFAVSTCLIQQRGVLPSTCPEGSGRPCLSRSKKLHPASCALRRHPASPSRRDPATRCTCRGQATPASPRQIAGAQDSTRA